MAKILVCIAWPYASGPRHLGHAAATFIPADVFARYHRMKGDEVLVVGGAGSHGTPTTRRAGASSPTATSRARARTAGSTAREGTSATAAATCGTRSSSRSRSAASTARPLCPGRRTTCSSGSADRKSGSGPGSRRGRAVWPPPRARPYSFRGKDNIGFHTIIWPAILLGSDDRLVLPHDVPATQYLNISGEKVSGGRGGGVLVP